MIGKIFWNMVYYSSGARSELINISPSKEKSVFKLIGLINITLTVLAFGSFALIIFFLPKTMALINRYFCAIGTSTILTFFVFHINRLFISSIRKDDTLLILFLENVPKLLFMFFNAVVIGMVCKYIIFHTGGDFLKIPEDGSDNFIQMYSEVMNRVIDDKIQKRIGIFLDIYFLLLTTSPILIRLLSSKGMYDYILEEVENREFYASIHLEDTKTLTKDAIKPGPKREEEAVNKSIFRPKLNKEELKSKIAKDLTQEVVSVLINHLPDNSKYYNELFAFSARLEMINHQRRTDLISSEKHLQERSKINYYLLELADIIISEN